MLERQNQELNRKALNFERELMSFKSIGKKSIERQFSESIIKRSADKESVAANLCGVGGLSFSLD